MSTIQRSTIVSIPAETAFRYLSDPAHLSEICAGVVAIQDVERHKVCVTEFSWTFKMIGVRFEGKAQLKDTHHNRQIDMHFWGGIQGSLRWCMEQADENTLLDILIEYIMPVPLLKKHHEVFITQQNVIAVDNMLQNVKRLLEAKTTVETSI